MSLIIHIPLILFFLVVGYSAFFTINTYYADSWQKFINLRVLDLWAYFVGFIGAYLLSWIGDRLVGDKVTWIITAMRAPYKVISIIVVNVILPILVAIPVWIFLNTVNPLFLRLGRVK